MGSSSGSAGGDVPLPFELSGDPSPATPRRSAPRVADGPRIHRLVGAHLASRGLPPGSELLIDPRRPRRGEVAIVRSAGRVRVGIFDLERGRAVLRSDRGTRWLTPDAVYVGVAALVAPTLDGMP